MKTLTVRIPGSEYNIYIKPNILAKVGELAEMCIRDRTCCIRHPLGGSRQTPTACRRTNPAWSDFL